MYFAQQNNEDQPSRVETPRYHGLDLLRGLAAFLIVGCHLAVGTTASASALMRYNQAALGILIALSGFFLARAMERKSTEDVMVARIIRLLPLHLGWSLLYLIALSILSLSIGTPQNYFHKLSPKFIAQIFLRGNAEIHLWFLPCLLYVSLAVVWIDRSLPAILRSWGGYLSTSVAALLIADGFNTHFANYDIRLLGFLLMGIGFFRMPRLRRRDLQKRLILPALLLMLVIHWFAHGILHGYALDFPLAFLALWAFADPRFPASRIGSFLSSVSLGVYLVHPLIARILTFPVKQFHPGLLGTVPTLLIWISVYLASAALTVLLRQIHRAVHKKRETRI